MILDTSFMIDLLRGRQAARSLMQEIEAGSESAKIPTVVAFELWEGTFRVVRPPSEARALADALAGHPAVELKPNHARRAGEVSAALRDRGEPIGDADLLIAGTALEEEEVLVTRNVRDFERVPGLRLKTY